MSDICGYEVDMGPYKLRVNGPPNPIYVLNGDDTTIFIF